MELELKVAAVEELFQRLDYDIAAFAGKTGLGCTFGCGKCCFKSDIEATPLEFLPFAWRYFEVHGEQALETMLSRIESEGSLCVLLNPGSTNTGLCSEYATRGLICRLFGYSARTNKYGTKELVTCTILKDQPGFKKASDLIESGGQVPVLNQWYLQLQGIDPVMGQEFLPINNALRAAINKVLMYQNYQRDEKTP